MSDNNLKKQETLLPYQNSNIPVEERIEDLLDRMTLDEKLREMCMYPSKILEEAGECPLFSEEKAAEFFQGMGIGALEAPKYLPRQNVAYMNSIH